VASSIYNIGSYISFTGFKYLAYTWEATEMIERRWYRTQRDEREDREGIGGMIILRKMCV
jgi:hypothetical protein